MVTAVVPVAEADAALAASLAIPSLLPQVDRVIVVAQGPSALALRSRKVDALPQAEPGIGNARKQGILAADDDLIISADADAWYPPGYAEAAASALSSAPYAKARRAEPLEDSVAARLELLLFYPVVNYEWALALRRSAFVGAGLHRRDYRGRYDIGYALALALGPPRPFDAAVYARLPTYAFRALLAGLRGAALSALAASPASLALLAAALR